MSTQQNMIAPSLDQVTDLTQRFTAITTEMGFLLAPSPRKRRGQRQIKPGSNALRVLEGRLEAARENRQLLPPAFDLPAFERDAALTDALQRCLASLEGIRTGISSSLNAVGSRAIDASAVAYRHICVSSSDRLLRTVVRLQSQSSRRTSGKGTTPSNEVSPEGVAPRPDRPSDESASTNGTKVEKTPGPDTKMS